MRVISILQRMRPGAGLIHARDLHNGNLEHTLATYDDAHARLNEVAQLTCASSLRFRLETAVGWLVINGHGAEVGELWPSCRIQAIRALPPSS